MKNGWRFRREQVNWLLVPTFLLAAAFFLFGKSLAGKQFSGTARDSLFSAMILLSAPGFLYAVYYLKVLGQPIWLYRWRSLPFTELAAGGAGLFAGYAQGAFVGRIKLSRVGNKVFFPLILFLVLAAPYLKPIARPLDAKSIRDVWSDGVCLQSTPSTCGPASAATLMRAIGKTVSEKELAMEAFTSATGTEIWYLARALRRHGATVDYFLDRPQPDQLRYPAIAGVRLAADGNGSGHFIAILDKQAENYIVVDPMLGRLLLSAKDLQASYYFTGFFLVVK